MVEGDVDPCNMRVSISFHRHVTQALMSPPSPFHSFSSHSPPHFSLPNSTRGSRRRLPSLPRTSLSSPQPHIYPTTHPSSAPHRSTLLFAHVIHPTTQGHGVLKTYNTASGTFLCLLTQFFFLGGKLRGTIRRFPRPFGPWISECSPKAGFTFALGPCVRFVPWSGTV
jgi:hypothetical protein